MKKLVFVRNIRSIIAYNLNYAQSIINYALIMYVQVSMFLAGLTRASPSTPLVQTSLSEQQFQILLVQADVGSRRKAHAVSRAPQRKLELPQKTLHLQQGRTHYDNTHCDWQGYSSVTKGCRVIHISFPDIERCPSAHCASLSCLSPF